MVTAMGGLLGGGPRVVSDEEVQKLEALMTAEESERIIQVSIILPNRTFLTVPLPDLCTTTRRLVLTCFYVWLQKEFWPSARKLLAAEGGLIWPIVVQGASEHDAKKFESLMCRAAWQCTQCSKCQNLIGGDAYIDPVTRDYVLVCAKCALPMRKRLALFPAPMQAFCLKLLAKLGPGPIPPPSKRWLPPPPPLPAAPLPAPTVAPPTAIPIVIDPPPSVTTTTATTTTSTNMLVEPSAPPLNPSIPSAPAPPGPVASLTGPSWVESQQLRLQDFYKRFAWGGGGGGGSSTLYEMKTKAPLNQPLQENVGLWKMTLGAMTRLRSPEESLVRRDLKEPALVYGCPIPPKLLSESIYLVQDLALKTIRFFTAIPNQHLVSHDSGGDDSLAECKWPRYIVRLYRCGECEGECSHYDPTREPWIPSPITLNYPAAPSQPPSPSPIAAAAAATATTTATAAAPVAVPEEENKRLEVRWFWREVREELRRNPKDYQGIWRIAHALRSGMDLLHWLPRQRTHLIMVGFLCEIQRASLEHVSKLGTSAALLQSLEEFWIPPVITLLQEWTMISVEHRMWSIQTFVDFAIRSGRTHRAVLAKFIENCSLYGLLEMQHVESWYEWDSLTNQWRAALTRDEAFFWLKRQIQPLAPTLCKAFAPRLAQPSLTNGNLISDMLMYGPKPFPALHPVEAPPPPAPGPAPLPAAPIPESSSSQVSLLQASSSSCKVLKDGKEGMELSEWKDEKKTTKLPAAAAAAAAAARGVKRGWHELKSMETKYDYFSSSIYSLPCNDPAAPALAASARYIPQGVDHFSNVDPLAPPPMKRIRHIPSDPQPGLTEVERLTQLLRDSPRQSRKRKRKKSSSSRSSGSSSEDVYLNEKKRRQKRVEQQGTGPDDDEEDGETDEEELRGMSPYSRRERELRLMKLANRRDPDDDSSNGDDDDQR